MELYPWIFSKMANVNVWIFSIIAFLFVWIISFSYLYVHNSQHVR